MTSPHKFLLQICMLIMLLSCSHLVFAEDWIYSVRRGDTLWDLCLKFTNKKNFFQEVGPYNKVDYPPSLLPGTRIRFPVTWLKEQPVSVSVIHVIGDVFAFISAEPKQRSTPPQNTFVQVKQNDQLTLGTTIKTGPASFASLRFADGSVLVLEENSELSLDKLSQHGSTGMVDSRINLTRGSVKTKVEKREVKSGFEVSTPSAIAAVRGTEFRITATESSAMLGEVFEGTIAISTPKGSQQVALSGGYGIKVEPNQKKLAPIKLLPMPEFILPAAIPLDTPLRWDSVEKAIKYNIQVLSDTNDEKLIKSHFTKQTTSPFPLNKQGCYKIRVSAYSAENLRGMPAQQTTCVAKKPSATTVSVSWPNKSPLISWLATNNTKYYRVETSFSKDFTVVNETFTTTETYIELTKNLKKPVYIKVSPVGNHDISGESSNIAYSKAPSNAMFRLLSAAAFTLLIIF